jgi:hypothetical protein
MGPDKKKNDFIALELPDLDIKGGERIIHLFIIC